MTRLIFSWSRLLRSFLLLVTATQGLLLASAFQKFDKQPEYTEVNPGEDVKLTCTVLNKRGTCSWQKNNKPVGIYKGKYEWAGSQESGDCSLLIKHVTIDFDDGEWECQVTASEFTAQDALTSTPVRLVVRVAPQWPRIEVNSTTVSPGNNISSDVGKTITVKCLSRYGNPPARLKWFLGDKELLVGSKQSNAPEVDNNRTWVATSLLDIVYTKDLYGRTLRCVALHKSYPKESQEVQVRLDVKYAPEVRIEGVPTTDLEEGRDTVVLRCLVDSNPPSAVRWKLGEQRIVSTIETLQFRPVKRRDSGSYYCEAENSVGTSSPQSVVIDVKYPPRIRKVGPTRLTTAPLYSEATFSCEAEGNPAPTYRWLQKIPSAGDTLFTRGSDAKLRILNITYDYQGEYTCRVTNVIAGNERTVESEPITIQVVGAPQVLRHAGTREVLAVRGEEALLRLIVCADPRPKRAIWEWGSEFVEAGKPNGRYQAELIDDEREDCYEARLHVQDVEPSDSRSYYLAVENDKGTDRHAVHLTVREPMWTTTLLSMMHHEPVPMTTLISIAAGCLVIFLFCVFVAIYVVRREKCCFARRGDFRPTDLESEKSDLNSEIGRKQQPSVIVGTGPVTTTAETMYNSSPGRRPHMIMAHGGGSPEAMKRNDDRSSRKRRKQTTPTATAAAPGEQKEPASSATSSGASSFLPLDYHNLNKHRHQTGKTDLKVRGNADYYYYSFRSDNGKQSAGRKASSGEFSPEKRAFSKAVTSLKNSAIMKSVNPLKNELKLPSSAFSSSKKSDSSYLENPQRKLDHSITQKLFDDMGNIAGSRQNNISYYSNESINYTGKGEARGIKGGRSVSAYASADDGDAFLLGNSCRNNYRDSEDDYLCDDRTPYKSSRRVAPIYMQYPYEPDSIDRMEI